MNIIAPLKAHPVILVVGVAAVLLYMQLRGGKTAPPPQAAPTMVDSNLIALEAQKSAQNADVAKASISAQTAGSYFDMLKNVTLNNNATQITLAHDSNVAQAAIANASIGATMFSTAAHGLSANYVSQLNANGANISFTSNNGANGTSPNSYGTVTSNSNYAYATQANPAGSATINTANTQLEEMFNNVLRAGMGVLPQQTALITTQGAATPLPSAPPIAQPVNAFGGYGSPGGSHEGMWSGNGWSRSDTSNPNSRPY